MNAVIPIRYRSLYRNPWDDPLYEPGVVGLERRAMRERIAALIRKVDRSGHTLAEEDRATTFFPLLKPKVAVCLVCKRPLDGTGGVILCSARCRAERERVIRAKQRKGVLA